MARTWPWGFVRLMENSSSGGNELVPPQDAAEQLDLIAGQLRDVGDGAFLDLATFPVGLADEDGRGRVAVGDLVDVHGYMYILKFARFGGRSARWRCN